MSRPFPPSDSFPPRHIGPSDAEIAEMLGQLGYDSLDALTAATVPESIRLGRPLQLPEAEGEHGLLDELRQLAGKNQVFRSFIGMGYHDCITPPVIQRNVLENPGWYTQYTPYQAEIAQGRLEALLNFQTMASDLTALPLANASLLDEATAAAEAMGMCRALAKNGGRAFFVAHDCHPQTIAVVQTRARAVGMAVDVGDPFSAQLSSYVGVLVQYPTTDGRVLDYGPLAERVHAAGGLLVVAADLLSLALLRPPGEFGADIAVGSTQRFGVPLGYGGPHAAFLATREAFKRQVPGRLVGLSRDAEGQPACRLALQTREQHIRRDKATSNICTAQVLLAVVASMYAVYHGPEGLKRIAGRVHALTAALATALRRLRLEVGQDPFFDTLRVRLAPGAARAVLERARERRMNLRSYEDGSLGVALDETVTAAELQALIEAFAGRPLDFGLEDVAATLPAPHARTSPFLAHDVFNRHHSEHEMLRYMRRLESRDLSLTTSMIPLGSCTMKLNATAEMLPVTWPEFGEMHPFAPAEQARGYAELFANLEQWLAEITGFAAVSLQPNAGSQGEFAGLLVIRAWHESRGHMQRNVCLIPVSAHGTNPASAVIAGFRVVPVACDERGNVRLDDLEAKAKEHRDALGVLMITYPSTHGVFEEDIRRICEVVHEQGGQVYMDGANLNAQVGLTRPGDIGADVCHLNLHKTFCVAAGTQVAVSDGTSRPIERLVPGGTVQAWSEREGGVRAARLEAVFRTGRKECVQVTLQDGRTITCTPDHRLLTSDGWMEAGRLEPFRHRLIVGPEAVPDDPAADVEAERSFRADYAGLSLSMAEATQRARTLAFFRLLGAACSDGTYSRDKTSGRLVVRLYFGTRPDARRAIADVALLTGARPTISTCRDVFAVRLPADLVSAVASVSGMGEPGRRVLSTRALPDFVDDPAMPLAILREFLGALFGGDGCAPVILHLQNDPATLKPVRFSQRRVDLDVVRTLQRQICDALGRLGVEATGDRLVLARAQPAAGAHERPRWIGGVTVVDGLGFAERVGFRYSAHKAARLSAAAAFWRMKRTVHAQRALANVAAARAVGPRPVWTTTVAEAYQELASHHAVLSPYYASFAGSARLSKQHLVNAISGTKGARSGWLGVRRTHRRVLAAPTGRGGASTAVPGLLEFLSEIGAASWFNAHTPCGSYSVTYATGSQDDSVERTFSLGVVDVRPVGERDVYDLTVADLHSFLANGVVVHNCIPHGGGGPGMGPIAVAPHLADFLPGHPVARLGTARSIGAVSAAPYGSPSILTIPWVYIRLMGPDGLKKATQVAILNANYMAKRLEAYYPVLFTGRNGRVAHEFILDLRPFAKSAGIEVEDVAKRLIDYGFHAPTMSFPVPGTLMIEPTESEPKDELDRFCDAMVAIREEIRALEEGRADRGNNPLKNAPHTMQAVIASDWDRPYSREEAAFPAPWVREHKFWPAVARIDNAYGDRNLVCTCPPVEVYGG